MSNRTRGGALPHAVIFKSTDAGGAFGDVVEELYKEGHVPEQHYVSAKRFLQDVRKFHGVSHGVVQYGERVQVSYNDRLPPLGGMPDAFRRVQNMLDGLYEHERGSFNYLIRKKELARGSLSDLGRMSSGYKTNKTTRAYAVGRVTSLLASIHELYGGP